jgi:hypothetical protein
MNVRTKSGFTGFIIGLGLCLSQIRYLLNDSGRANGNGVQESRRGAETFLIVFVRFR